MCQAGRRELKGALLDLEESGNSEDCDVIRGKGEEKEEREQNAVVDLEESKNNEDYD